MNPEINLIVYLKECDKAYYNSENTLVSDLDYDVLKSRTKELFPNDPYFQEIGSTPLRQKISLPYILGSLDKQKLPTIEKWLFNNHVDLVISEKLDGSSIFVQYKNGKVIMAATRGDGEVGTSLKEKAFQFCPKINVDYLVETRGEVYLTEENFQKLQNATNNAYISKRNAVAGILNRDSLEHCELLSIKFYEHINPELKNTEYERFLFLNSIGLETPVFELIPKQDIKKTVEILIKFLEESKLNEYLVDGVVVAKNNSIREDVKYPKDKISFKVNEDGVPCKVLGIHWQLTRSGKMVPVIDIEPKEISGAMISNVMGHNYKNIKELKIKSGTIISVCRSGEIIPFLVEVLENNDKEAEIPTNCPFCDSILEVDGVDILCKNPSCKEQQIFKIEHFFRTLDAESFTKTTLEKLPISSILSVYKLTDEDFISLKGFGMKKTLKILEEVEKTKKTTKAKLLAAFGILSLGLTNATKIIDYCESHNMNSFSDLFTLKKSDLESIEGIGTKNSEKIVDGLLTIKSLYNELNENGIEFIFEQKKVLTYSLEGKAYCFTGSGPVGRKELIALCEAHGHHYADIGKADVLVCEDVNGTSSKLTKAKKKGTLLISYEQFMEQMNGN